MSGSGTNSLRFAPFDLGHSDLYHYSCIYENPKDAELWLEAFQAKYQGKGKSYGRRDWDALLGHCMAVSDTPAVHSYKEFLEAYPEAKVILTVRDTPEQWHSSVLNTIQPFLDWRHSVRPGFYDRMYRYLLPKDAFWHMNEVLRQGFMYPDFKNVGHIFYQGFNDEIQRIVPGDRLLVYNVKEGWKPLCDFLGKDAPAHPFPKTNERAVLAGNVRMMKAAMDAEIHRKTWRLAGLASALGAACVGVIYSGMLRLW